MADVIKEVDFLEEKCVALDTLSRASSKIAKLSELFFNIGLEKPSDELAKLSLEIALAVDKLNKAINHDQTRQWQQVQQASINLFNVCEKHVLRSQG
jgi:hypothetical protein